MVAASRHLTLLPSTTITVAGTTIGSVFTGLAGVREALLEAKFAVGSGGTSAKAYVQTSVDGGATFFDIACFAFVNTPVNKLHSIVVNPATPFTANTTPGDAALADNTVLNGMIGDQFRVKLITVGTYTGGTTIELHAIVKG